MSEPSEGSLICILRTRPVSAKVWFWVSYVIDYFGYCDTCILFIFSDYIPVYTGEP